MTDNALVNTLPQAEIPAADPLAAAAPTGTGEPQTVADNIAPDPAKLKAEIEELENKRKKAEEDAIYWRKQKAESRDEYFRDRARDTQQPAASTPPASMIGSEPQPNNFDDYSAYVKALTDHRVKAAKAEWDREAERRNQEQSKRQRMESLNQKLQEGYTKYQDFEEVVFDRTATHISPMVVDILAECEFPADVAYYLNLPKNRVEGVAISRMTPVQAARAIAKIESKISSGQPVNTPAQIQTKTPSKAPPPINPIGSKSSGLSEDPNKMTQKEYNKWRESQGARRY